MTTIAANAGASISSTSQLSVASVTCTADIQGRDIAATRELQCDGAATLNSTLTVWGNTSMAGSLTVNGTNITTALSGKQATLTTSSVLSVASVTTTAVNTMSGGLRISGGQGTNETGALLRLTGTGDSVYNTSSVFWGNSSVDLHVIELSWQGWNHFLRPNSSTAYAQTMGVSLTTGAWVFYKGYSAASDQSLKGDAQDASLEDSLNMLRAVSAKTYRRLDLPEGEGERLGFIAQDVDAACPSAWSNLVETARYKWTGNGEGGEIRTLDYARLVCPLWQACKSMLARIEQLEQRVAQLSAAECKAWARLRSKRSAA